MLVSKNEISELKFDGYQNLEIKILDNIELTLLNVKDHFEQTKTFTSSKKVKVILDLCNLKFNHIPNNVMEYMAKNEYSKYQIATAIIIEGLGQKLLANFYIKVIKPEVKTKFFTDKREGLLWLEKINEKETAPAL